MKVTYHTLKRLSEGLYKEKGSRFVGIGVACYNETEVKELLNEWNSQHSKARHLCYAYRFGLDNNVFRANDDGEPNNSAGAPILGQIDSFELTNVLIGVVRYYGGTKLGVGGLINAYRTAAKEAITNGEIVELEVYDWVQINFSYEDMPHIMNFLKRNNFEPKSKEFDKVCELVLPLPVKNSSFITTELNAFDSVQLTNLGRY